MGEREQDKGRPHRMKPVAVHYSILTAPISLSLSLKLTQLGKNPEKKRSQKRSPMDYICSRCLRPRPPGLYPQQPVPAGAAAAEPELVRMVFIYLVNDQWLTVTLEVATLFPDGFLLIGGGGGTQLLGYHYPGAWNVAPAPLFIRAWQYDYTYYDQQLPLAFIRCNCPACLARDRQGRG